MTTEPTTGDLAEKLDELTTLTRQTNQSLDRIEASCARILATLDRTEGNRS